MSFSRDKIWNMFAVSLFYLCFLQLWQSRLPSFVLLFFCYCFLEAYHNYSCRLTGDMVDRIDCEHVKKVYKTFQDAGCMFSNKHKKHANSFQGNTLSYSLLFIDFLYLSTTIGKCSAGNSCHDSVSYYLPTCGNLSFCMTGIPLSWGDWRMSGSA